MELKILGILFCMMLFIPVFSATDSSGNSMTNSEKSVASTINPDVAIKLVPHNPPIVIQATGGNLDFNIDVTNNEGLSSRFNVWTNVILPNQDSYSFGPANFFLPAGWSANKDLIQNIPVQAPPGNYIYMAYVGIFPNDIWNNDSFNFEKISDIGGWYTQNSGTSTSVYLTDVYFNDSNNGWAVGSRNTIIHTTDGGDNWYPQNPPPSVNYYGVHFSDVNSGWAVGSGGKILNTSDGGNTWDFQTSGTNYGLYDVHFIDANNGWAVGGKEASFTEPIRIILHTTDGGSTWNTQHYQSNKIPLRSIDFFDSNTGCAVGDLGTIICTNDGGNNWIEQNSGTSQGLSDVYISDTNTGWVVGGSGTILHTSNGGVNWYAQNSGTTNSLNSVSFVGANTGWIAGGNTTHGTILHTTNGGSNWFAQDSGSDIFLSSIYFTDVNNGWATGNYGTVIHTTTGGD